MGFALQRADQNISDGHESVWEAAELRAELVIGTRCMKWRQKFGGKSIPGRPSLAASHDHVSGPGKLMILSLLMF